jgi:hypothetical protein
MITVTATSSRQCRVIGALMACEFIPEADQIESGGPISISPSSPP